MTAADRALHGAERVERVARALAQAEGRPYEEVSSSALAYARATIAAVDSAATDKLVPDGFALSTYLRERDLLVAAADALAYAIAPAAVIGEHVGDNDPWENALEALADERRQHDADVARLEGVVAQQAAMFDGFIRSLAIANGRSDDAERTAWGLPTTGEAS